MTTHNTHKTSITPAKLKPTIPASTGPQTHSLGCVVTGSANNNDKSVKLMCYTFM